MSRYLSYTDLDAIAARVFRGYLRLPEVLASGRVLAVDPDLLLRSLLGLKLAYRHLSPDGSVLGVTAYEELSVGIFEEDDAWFELDGKTVLAERDLWQEGRTGQRHFTLVHEGCHHILKMLFPRDYGVGPAERRAILYRDVSGRKNREEWQVDRLASAVLMPRELVEQAMYLTGQEGRIEMLNALWRPKEYERFCNMCGILGVSRQALSIRMQSLGLLGESYLRNPNAILDIMMEDDEIG